MERLNKKVGGLFSEFWAFAAKGNIFDLAVAVIIGNAFGAIVSSLVANVVMPVLSVVTNSVDFTKWEWTLRAPQMIGGATSTPVVIGYGHLLQAVVNFLIVALAIFIFYKLISNLRKRLERTEKEEGAPAAPPSAQEKLLMEIRDLLKDRPRQ